MSPLNYSISFSWILCAKNTLSTRNTFASHPNLMVITLLRKCKQTADWPTAIDLTRNDNKQRHVAALSRNNISTSNKIMIVITNTQCWNFKCFYPHRFYGKSILSILVYQKYHFDICTLVMDQVYPKPKTRPEPKVFSQTRKTWTQKLEENSKPEVKNWWKMANFLHFLSWNPVKPENLTQTRRIFRNLMNPNPKNWKSFKPIEP